MALNTYSALQASVASWLNREDLSAQIPDFITLAEARFNRDLRVNAMLRRFSTVVTQDYVQLPADWLEHVSLVLTSAGPDYGALTYLSNEGYNDLRNRGLAGSPRYYTIVDDKIILLPAPTSNVTVEIVYYARIPALSSGNPSNWLLARSPDLYLYASLVNAEAYLQNDERIPLWMSAAERIITDMKLESEKAKRPQGALSAFKRSFG